MNAPSDAALTAYLDEALPAEQLAEIERRLRSDADLRDRLLTIIGRQDAGLHSLGVIWRRNRLSCPSRDELGQSLLGVLEPEADAYIRFHIEVIGCGYCAANRQDLISVQQGQRAAADQSQAARRQKFFQTSAGRLRSPG